MINYDEMEQVIVSLKEYVSRMQKISQSQELLSKSIDDLDNLKKEVQCSIEKIDKYTEQIVKMENDHSALTTQFDRIMEDYRKLHSAFELIDIELKKIDEKLNSVESVNKRVKENNELLQSTSQSTNLIKQKQRTFHIIFAIVSVIEVVGLLLSIFLK